MISNSVQNSKLRKRIMNKISELTKNEMIRQKETLNLIASENYPSPKVLELLGSVWSNKYGEGYPEKRYYAGNVHTDDMEKYVQELALEVFDKTGQYDVNVQILSGSPANMMVYLAMLEYNDTIMSLNLNNGGHISHLHATSNWNKFFKHVNYDVKEVETNLYEIDMEDFENKLKKHKPKLTIIGCSSYPRSYKFKKMCELAHNAGSLVLADVAHINGLIATGLHDSPFKSDKSGADFVSMTTHKTFRGPRAGLLFFKKEFAKPINKTIFPGTSGGPHFNKIAAVGQALLEMLGEDEYPDKISFQKYSENVIKNCKILENSLLKNGLEIISPTQTHLCLIKFPDELNSLEVQKKLEEVGIITNRNVIPFDKKSPWKPSGMRLGSAALTSRGMTEVQFEKLGELIADITFDRKLKSVVEKEVKEMAESLNWWYKN